MSLKATRNRPAAASLGRMMRRSLKGNRLLYSRRRSSSEGLRMGEQWLKRERLSPKCWGGTLSPGPRESFEADVAMTWSHGGAADKSEEAAPVALTVVQNRHSKCKCKVLDRMQLPSPNGIHTTIHGCSKTSLDNSLLNYTRR